MSSERATEPLTRRQREVLDLLVRGRTNFEIAQTLGISLDGAKWHVREVLARLGVDSREEAANIWRSQRSWTRRGLVGLLLSAGTEAKAAVIASVVLMTAVAAGALYTVRGEDTWQSAPDESPALTTPSPTAPPGDEFAPHTGIPVVDAAVDAVRAKDAAAVIALLVSTDERCKFNLTTPGPGPRAIPCPPVEGGQPEDGVLVQTTRGLEDGEPRRGGGVDDLVSRHVPTVRQFHGVSKAQRDVWDGFFVPWKYEVLASASQAFVVLLLDDTGIVGVVATTRLDPTNRNVGDPPRADWLVAPLSVPRFAPEKNLYVIGRDTEIRFVLDLPPACAGKPLAIRLYEYPPPGVSGGIQSMREAGLATDARAVGTFMGDPIVTFKLPATISGPMRVRAGVLSSCLSEIAVQNELNLALLAPPGDSEVARFEVFGQMLDRAGPRGSVSGPVQTDGEYWGGELTAAVDGYACGTASLVDPAARNARGNVVFRVGTSDQPAACRATGHEVVFVAEAFPGGAYQLWGTFEYVPGVTQLVHGLGPQPPHALPPPPLIRE